MKTFDQALADRGLTSADAIKAERARFNGAKRRSFLRLIPGVPETKVRSQHHRAAEHQRLLIAQSPTPVAEYVAMFEALNHLVPSGARSPYKVRA
jgi:hypothetical protein